MTSLQEAFDAVVKPRIGRPCRTCLAVAEMDDVDRATLAALFADPDVTNPSITAALTGAGFDVTIGSVSRHRRGECKPLD